MIFSNEQEAELNHTLGIKRNLTNLADSGCFKTDTQF